MSSRDRTGETVDRYRIERLLGAGGFGAVYAAQHVHMQRRVALKLLHREQLAGPKGRELRDRFLREAQAAAAIDHPGIVQVYDSGVAGEDTFVAMELLQGEDLDSFLKREGTVGPGPAVAFVLRLLDVVGAAHRVGIVHRDLKPANIFLVNNADALTAFEERPLKLLDFGISKVRGAGIEKLTGTGMVMGTPHYMAPEMFMGVSEVDGRADLYAIGAILYEMLTGRTPHSASSYEHLVVQAATTPAPSLSVHRTDLQQGLIDVVDRALRTDPADRYASAEEFADALARVDTATTQSDAPQNDAPQNDTDRSEHAPSPVSGFGDTQPAIASMAPPSSANAWRPAVIGAALLGALGLGLAAAWALSSDEGEQASTVQLPSSEPLPPRGEEPVADLETADPETVAPESDEPTQAPTPTTAPEPPAHPSAPVPTESAMSAPVNMSDTSMLAAPPRTNEPPTNTPPANEPLTNEAEAQEPVTMGAPREVRPGRVRIPCGANGFEADVYLAGPRTSIRVSSGRQGGVTDSTAVLRQTVQSKGPSILQCFGRDPIPIGQEVDFHVGSGGVVSNVAMRIRCPISPRVQRCVTTVFESIDFSAVQRGEGDARVGFSATD